MAMINYADKVALNSNSDIADINKVKADDMNEIKKAFNDQVAQGWYQTGVSPTFTYSSWDSTTNTGVVNSNLDLTPYLSVGMKVKFNQSSTIKYGFITKISSSQITLYMGNNYTLNSSGISNTFYSMLKAPYGFPLNPDKWSVVFTNSLEVTTNNPTVFVWYNYSGFKLTIPIGSWNVSYQGNLGGTSYRSAIRVQATLSTTNNDDTDADFQTYIGSSVASGSVIGLSQVYREKSLELSTKTTYYLNYRTILADCDQLFWAGNRSKTIIKAVCNYL